MTEENLCQCRPGFNGSFCQNGEYARWDNLYGNILESRRMINLNEFQMFFNEN